MFLGFEQKSISITKKILAGPLDPGRLSDSILEITKPAQTNAMISTYIWSWRIILLSILLALSEAWGGVRCNREMKLKKQFFFKDIIEIVEIYSKMQPGMVAFMIW